METQRKPQVIKRWLYTTTKDGPAQEGHLALFDDGKVYDRIMREDGVRVEIHDVRFVTRFRAKRLLNSPSDLITHAHAFLTQIGYNLAS